ncbi:MAG: phosphoribosylformylglycinamidine synthase subunit PurQ [Planctomycetota bacterium]|jgi:phosphoribosylformylglycinamidine synthase
MGKNKRVRGLVITGFGLNCEAETAQALRSVGAEADLVHFNDLLAGKATPADYQILCLIGGFSFGDHIAAGMVFANKIKYRLKESLQSFVNAGRLVIGICNGFQTLVKLGLLPGFPGESFARKVSLTANDSGVFRDAWVTLIADPESPCVFTRNIDRIDLPVRHGEGKFVVMDDSVDRALTEGRQKVLFYAHPKTGEPTEEFPHNPNGSPGGVAGLCDPSGRIFGLMPHPEAHLLPWNHPQWMRRRLKGDLPEEGEGVSIFRNAVDFAAEHLAR